MRVKEYMDDVFSQAIKPGRSRYIGGDMGKEGQFARVAVVSDCGSTSFLNC